MKRKQRCKRCKREYDGAYPCPCGSLSFEELKSEDKQ